MIAEPPVEATELEPQYAAELALVAERLGSDAWRKIDQLEADIAALPEEMQARFPLNHVFTPGIYVRECFLPKGTLLTSRIHLTEHPFIISAGIVSVWDAVNGVVTLRAPYTGVTQPGTRRILFAHEDTIWSTIHANPDNETDPDKLVLKLTFTGGKFAALGAAAANPQPALNERGGNT